MRRPPPLSEIPKFPIVGGTIALAVAVTFASWFAKFDIGPLCDSAEIRRGELWRLLTSALPHINFLHLAFDCYWIWVFGTLIERTLGHVKTLAIFILFAAVSGAAEYAILSGGVGLSGVGYGLFGLLWVLSRRDPRFAGAVDPMTALLFVVWFFICIAMTVAGSPIANIAHGVGAIAGALLGWTLSAPRKYRLPSAAALALLTAASLFGAVVARPWINVSADRGEDEAHLAYIALLAGHNQDALRWLHDATLMQPRDARNWYNMGVAYDRLKKPAEARAMFKHACELNPADPDYQAATRD